MNKLEILEKHFPNVFMLVENAKYNFEQDITKYFGKKIIVIYDGHGGSGWDLRILVGEFKKDPNYFLLMREDNGTSLLYKEDWYCKIILPENFEKMNDFFINKIGIKPDIISPIRMD